MVLSDLHGQDREHEQAKDEDHLAEFSKFRWETEM